MEQSIQDLFLNPIEIDSLPKFILSMALSALLGFILSLVYVRFGNSLSNRKTLAGNFLMLAVTTTLIITIVKSSLALSLGLVGALSIVRFRAAIKEPEELTYLFLAIAIGLGMGASQPILTIVAFIIIVGIIAITQWTKSTPATGDMFLTISGTKSENLSASKVLEMLTALGAKASLKRSDNGPDIQESSFLVDFPNVQTFEQFNKEVNELDPGATISCLDNHGIGY